MRTRSLLGFYASEKIDGNESLREYALDGNEIDDSGKEFLREISVGATDLYKMGERALDRIQIISKNGNNFLLKDMSLTKELPTGYYTLFRRLSSETYNMTSGFIFVFPPDTIDTVIRRSNIFDEIGIHDKQGYYSI